jgi:hypothetical protein
VASLGIINLIFCFFRNKSGVSYGLYQRFYWDSDNVPFGGIAGFKRQGPRGGSMGCGGGSPVKVMGGKIHAGQKEPLKMEGPSPTSYFLMGRSEIRDNFSAKFPRERRILPGEIAQMKPDYTQKI